MDSSTADPDQISSTLIDRVDRSQMHKCLQFMYNKAWSRGYFFKEWKREDRAVIPKPGKDDYHELELEYQELFVVQNIIEFRYYRKAILTYCQLSQRLSCQVKINGQFGEWIESVYGTSAGTNLGPLLFLIFMHDIPQSIFSKFVDDLVSK